MIAKLWSHKGPLLPGGGALSLVGPILSLAGQFMNKPKKPQLPPPAPALPTQDDPASKRKEREAAVAAVQRKGLLGTRKSGTLGVTDDPETSRGRLLGDSGRMA